MQAGQGDLSHLQLSDKLTQSLGRFLAEAMFDCMGAEDEEGALQLG